MKKISVFFICLLLLNIIPLIIFSQQNTNIQTNKELFQFTTLEKEVEAPSYFFMVIKTLTILTIFGFSIYYIFKFISKKQGLIFPQLNFIKVITSITVGSNRFIQIIEVGNKYYLIGSTDNSVNLLSEIIDKETLNMIKILKNKQTEQVQTPTFGSFFNNLLGDISKKIVPKDGLQFLKKQKDRLNNLKILNHKNNIKDS